MKPITEMMVYDCDGCPFLDRARDNDPCNYCSIGGPNISFSSSYRGVPRLCPLRSRDIVVKTTKRPIKTKE